MSPILQILRKLLAADSRDEASAAVAQAQLSVEAAESRTAEIDRLSLMAHGHGRRNHFGERWEAYARRLDPPTAEVVS